MSETTSTPEPERTTVVEHGRRLTAVAAWVGIVAGTVFVVAVIFFSGFILGAHAGGHHGGHHRGGDGQVAVFHRGGPPMGGPHGGFGPGGPGFGPEGPGGPGGQPPSPSSAPTTAPARP
ncbi:hypothetical protein [Mycobacterium sp. 1274761.0]|uniref:hypothetical protein n=1 Tax=Mycobacterium sp. 1274761.0 TaxID=1834077 RepID=UPI0009ED148C|nr:hypothetical protein [Mycobacterium sp. 1274761.0]